MKTAIACEDWKVDIFTRILDDKGYEYEVNPGLTEDTRFIAVEIVESDHENFTQIVRDMNAAAARSKHH